MLAARERRWPERVEVDWRRFDSGLWRGTRGDISAASNLEALPKATPFKHEGALYVPCGMTHRGALQSEANCHPIIRPEDYRGPDKAQFSYEGMVVIVKREKFRLGPKVVFVAREPTVAEWRQHLKTRYGDGWAVADKPTYATFLDSLRGTASANWLEALAAERTELGHCSKEAIRTLLEPASPTRLDQLSFPW